MTPRVEDAALLFGRGQFLDDLDPLPGALSAAVVRSPHPHARIRGVDTAAALGAPGVAAVIGPDEVAAELRPFPLSVKTPMPYQAGATSRARFVGEPVAVVVATDRYLAEDAAELVQVGYEPLPSVTDTAQALRDSAPLLHEEAAGNVATDRTFTFGPVDEAFSRADHVISGEYSFPRYSSMPMECYSVVASWTDGADGLGPAVEAWANFHGPFSMMPVLAGALGLPVSRLRLHVPADIGGSFGIKAGIYPYVALMALASKHAGRPVRWTEDRIEHLLASSAGADRMMRFEAAVAADGTVTALRADLVRQRRRLPAAAGAEHAVPVFRQHHRRLPYPRGADPGPRGRDEQDADRAQPWIRRPAAVLRPGTPDGQDRRPARRGPRGVAPP